MVFKDLRGRRTRAGNGAVLRPSGIRRWWKCSQRPRHS